MKHAVPLAFVAGLAVGSLATYFLAAGHGSNVQAQDAPAAKPAPAQQAPQPRGKEAWAEKLERPGIGNLHKVSGKLFRGAQPTAEGMGELKKLGVRTVVNLRLSASDRDEIGETGLAYEHIYFNPYNPEDKEMVRFLQIVTDPQRAPAFVHCRHGSDRTGTMCALYRIAVQGWDKEDAIKEMTEHDLGFHDEFFQNLVDYLRKLDVENIRQRAGLKP